MLTARYMVGTKNLPAIFQKIVEGAAPDKFTISHLKGIGFTSSNDQAALPLLKDLKFLASDGTPTSRYHAYRDKSRSRKVLGEAIREAYDDLFHLNENLSDSDKPAIIGRFKSTHNATDLVADRQAATFLALLKMADLPKPGHEPPRDSVDNSKQESLPTTATKEGSQVHVPAFSGLRYNIEVHLPATKDVEVYNSIFKSLREHLLND